MTSPKKIVVIEDEPDIAAVLDYNLKREGYQVTVCDDGGQGLEWIKNQGADLVILDLMLPGVDGLEVCRVLRSQAATAFLPIIMLTAKSDESDVVAGLEQGADDYVAKPFAPKELLARVKAQLRRVMPTSTDQKPEPLMVFEGLQIDAVKHEVQVDGQVVPFTATEFKILQCLMTHPQRVLSREILLKTAVGEGTFVVDRNIDVHIRVIRKKLGRHRDVITTVRSVGYRFDPPTQGLS